MATLSFIHYDALLKAGIQPTNYAGLPDDVVCQIYSDILDGIPLVDEEEHRYLTKAGNNPQIHRLLCSLSSLYSVAATIDPLEASAIFEDIEAIFTPSKEFWEKRSNSFIRRHHIENVESSPIKDVAVWVENISEYQEISYNSGSWLLKHIPVNRRHSSLYTIITVAQANVVFILLLQDKDIPPSLYLEWQELSEEASLMADKFNQYAESMPL